jgi:hypothetical protein
MAKEKEKATKKERKPMKWTFPEYVKHERKRGWYLWIIGISIFLIIYGILKENWILALIVVMFGIIFLINHRNHPEELALELGHDGIKIGSRVYKYEEINKFWIMYNPPHVKTLYFDMKSPVKPRIPIPLEDENPIEVKAFLREYLEEDIEAEQEPFSDAFGRVFKL